MAKLLNKDPETYRGEKDRFIKDLQQFHANRGSPFKTIPTIDGKEIDLYQLYWLVTAQGGWEKVNKGNDWEELLTCFEVPEATANGAVLLKQTYLRYLDPYEKVHYLGEEEDGEDNWYGDEEDSRARRQKAQRIQSTVPLSYQHNQHDFSDDIRKAAGLSSNVYKKTDYDRLALSLTSPLPNEQDFGINVCTLLSNEGRHTLKLGKCPRLLDLLLGHAGIFNHHSLQEYLNGNYCESRKYDMIQFWYNVCKDWSVRDLMLHPPTSTPEIRKSCLEKAKSALLSGKNNGSNENDHVTQGAKRLDILKAKAEEEILFGREENIEEEELFAVGAKYGTRELSGQRVLQIATILRNLSFEEDNATVLAKNLTCLRFCLLCASSKWSNLNQMGFDILSNVASEVNLDLGYTDSCVTDTLISTLVNCTGSNDRFQVVSALDILTKLCQLEANENFISEVITSEQSPVYDQLVKYLSLHDIHLLISTLECLYALSCLGESTCNSIAKTSGALEALVSLMTVEAQSYGPKACILMRVVETVPGSSIQAVSTGNDTRQQAQVGQPQLSQLQPVVPNQSATTQGDIAKQAIQNHLPSSVSVTQERSSSPAVVNAGSETSPATSIQPGLKQMRGQLIQVQRPQSPTVVSQQSVVTGQGQPVVNPAPQGNGAISSIVISSSQAQVTQAKPQAPVMVVQKQQMPVVVAGQQGQPQRVIIPSQTQQLLQQQTPVQLQPQSMQSQPQAPQSVIQQPTLQQPQLPLAQQPTTQQSSSQHQQSGSQQVQLRVSNDDPNRQFCLSWLKATYEASPGSCIDQQIMYKQYLASLHKLGKRDVISGQHYAIAVRTLFGGNVGPVRRQLPSGQLQMVFDGVKVRAQPLPLKIPQMQPMIQQSQTSQTPIQTPSQPSAQLAPSNQPHLVPQAITGTAHPATIQVMPTNGSTGMVPSVQVQHAQVVQHVYRSQSVTAATTAPTQAAAVTQSVIQSNPPSSPILTNLLHRGSLVTATPGSNGDCLQSDVVESASLNEQNKDLKFNDTPAVNGVMHSDTGKAGTKFEEPPVVNGVEESNLMAGNKRTADEVMVNGATPAKRAMLDGSKPLCNGVVVGNGPSSVMMPSALETEVEEDGAVAVTKQASIQQVIPQKQIVQTAGGQHIIVRQSQAMQLAPGSTLVQHQQQQLVTSDGKNILFRTPVNAEATPKMNGDLNVSLPSSTTVSGPPTAGPATTNGKTIIILQPNQNGQSQGVVQPSGIQPGSQIQIGNPTPGSTTTVLNGSGSLQVTHNGKPQQTVHIHHTNGSNGGTVTTVPLGTVSQQTTLPNSPGVAVQQPVASQPNVSAVVSEDTASVGGSASASTVIASSTTTSMSPSVPIVSETPLVQTVPGAAATASATSTTSTSGTTVIPPPNPQKPFLCEWQGCLQAFNSPKDALNHAINTHCPAGLDDQACLWHRCDGMKRKRFSLMQHIMDRHCHPQVMKLVAVRRVQMAQSGRSDVPLPPVPPPHPGYAPNAALHAIKRHAQEFVVPKAQALGDEKEGPVTKSIRLTSSLILKNLVTYSNLGKRRLKAHESHLSTVALSNVESSRTVGQILYDMCDSDSYRCQSSE